MRNRISSGPFGQFSLFDPRQPPARDGKHVGGLQIRSQRGECGRGLEYRQASNVALLGGHSVDNEQIMFGYSITGLIDPNKVATNAGARTGDVIILTKPIGTGVISTGS